MNSDLIPVEDEIYLAQGDPFEDELYVCREKDDLFEFERDAVQKMIHEIEMDMEEGKYDE